MKSTFGQDWQSERGVFCVKCLERTHEPCVPTVSSCSRSCMMQSVLPCNMPDVVNRLNACRDARAVRPFPKTAGLGLSFERTCGPCVPTYLPNKTHFAQRKKLESFTIFGCWQLCLYHIAEAFKPFRGVKSRLLPQFVAPILPFREEKWGIGADYLMKTRAPIIYKV